MVFDISIGTSLEYLSFLKKALCLQQNISSPFILNLYYYYYYYMYYYLSLNAHLTLLPLEFFRTRSKRFSISCLKVAALQSLTTGHASM